MQLGRVNNLTKPGTDIQYFGWQAPALLAILLTVVVMAGFAWLVNRYIFSHLVNQEPIILFMATIGLAYFLEGVADLMWGSEIKKLDVGLPQGINDWIDQTTFEAFGYGFFIDNLDIVATIIAALLVVGLVLFSQYTKQGRALRAVADDHQAALSVGISLNFIWVLVWSIAGFVALVAGIMWGAKSGVQFSLSLIALKALPVLMRIGSPMCWRWFSWCSVRRACSGRRSLRGFEAVGPIDTTDKTTIAEWVTPIDGGCHALP